MLAIQVDAVTGLMLKREDAMSTFDDAIFSGQKALQSDNCARGKQWWTGFGDESLRSRGGTAAESWQR